jgi:hypothetical protein
MVRHVELGQHEVRHVPTQAGQHGRPLLVWQGMQREGRLGEVEPPVGPGDEGGRVRLARRDADVGGSRRERGVQQGPRRLDQCDGGDGRRGEGREHGSPVPAPDVHERADAELAVPLREHAADRVVEADVAPAPDERGEGGGLVVHPPVAFTGQIGAERVVEQGQGRPVRQLRPGPLDVPRRQRPQRANLVSIHRSQ